MEAGILKKPVLYLSDFFEQNRQLYYDHLTAIRTRNDLKTWLRFFMVGIVKTSGKAIQGLRNILTLKKECEVNRISHLGKRMNSAQTLLNSLFSEPLVRPHEVARITGLSIVSSYKLIEDFVRLGILHEITGNQRNRIFAFREYFDVFD